MINIWNYYLVLDCSTCIGEVTEAATECLDVPFFHTVDCILNTVGVGSTCYDCVCEVIEEVGAIFGQEWSCWNT